MHCKFCTSDEDLKWLEPYKKGDRPVRSLDGKPHICKNDKPQEITSKEYKKEEICNICHKPFTLKRFEHLHKV